MKIAKWLSVSASCRWCRASYSYLSKELVKQGHEVYVITYPHKDNKILMVFM